MSIIHDALKKVQQAPYQSQIEAVQPVLASSPTHEISRPIIAIMITALSIAVVIIMVILWSLAMESSRPAHQTVMEPFQPAAVQTS